MYYWTPKKIKELKEKGYKLQFYNSKEILESEKNKESLNKKDKESEFDSQDKSE
tara:strand:- start:1578 stop:1739 length:162 start_codon:yes stop_codon:yes gene_type:complete